MGDRPCRELGLMWCEAAGEFGVLEAGELLWEDVPGEGHVKKGLTESHTRWIYE